MNNLKNGVWPTMITPFKKNLEIDYNGLEKLVEWYKDSKVDGLFAVCQSSEMFQLSLNERVELAKAVKSFAGDDVEVIASGIVGDTILEQVEEVKQIAATNVDAVVLITNRFAKEDESDEIFLANLQELLNRIPADIPLGFYECPYPYKRLLTPETLRWCADTGRFLFLKDTSCDIEMIRAKLHAIEGTRMKIYNANTETLLESLKEGVVGYSGVMANFHPDLYVWLMNNYESDKENSIIINDFLSLVAYAERFGYPTCAKYYLTIEGILEETATRNNQNKALLNDEKAYIQFLYGVTEYYRNQMLR